MKTINEISSRMSQSISLKIGVIGFLILILLIPAGMIRSLISERMITRDEAVNEVSDKWGHRQTLTGPILILPYYEISVVNDEEYKTKKQLFILPESLEVKGQINPEIRYRGIYKVIVYGSDLAVNGNFVVPDLAMAGIDSKHVDWDNSTVVFGLSDMRGIQNEVNIRWKEENIAVDPGIKNKNIASSGFTAKTPLLADDQNIRFELNMVLNGSKGLYFTPLGKTTKVHLNSDWSTPSFIGSFLPDNRNITDSGFTASWTVLHLNRNYPQHWIGNAYDLTRPAEQASYAGVYSSYDHSVNLPGSAFGVNLLFEVDQYQKSMRSVKYAIMFIALTFLLLFLVEIINKKRIHPVQYLLISFALLLFYTLLLALSEQIGFNLAYLFSALAIVGLITAYSHGIFRTAKLTLISSLSLCILYIFLYVILQMEGFSLLLGSIGLFIILGIVMYLSKKVNWYGQLKTDIQTETLKS